MSIRDPSPVLNPSMWVTGNYYYNTPATVMPDVFYSIEYGREDYWHTEVTDTQTDTEDTHTFLSTLLLPMTFTPA